MQTVGMSGTVTTVKALELGLTTYRRSAVDRTLFDMANLPPIRDDLIQGDMRALWTMDVLGGIGPIWCCQA